MVMTDGESNDEPANVSHAIRDQGVTIYAVGVGSSASIPYDNLAVIASSPNVSYVRQVTWDNLANLTKDMHSELCGVAIVFGSAAELTAGAVIAILLVVLLATAAWLIQSKKAPSRVVPIQLEQLREERSIPEKPKKKKKKKKKLKIWGNKASALRFDAEKGTQQPGLHQQITSINIRTGKASLNTEGSVDVALLVGTTSPTKQNKTRVGSTASKDTPPLPPAQGAALPALC